MNKKLVCLLTILGSIIFFALACADKDACKDVDCGANGTCIDGVCDCIDGYEGAACAEEWAQKFLGEYEGFDVCPSGTIPLNKPVKITRISATEVQLFNLGSFQSTLIATVKLATAASTKAEDLSFDDTDTQGRKFVGSATISGSKITGSYIVTYTNGISENCTFEYEK
ncbi:MAG: calcium-binding EGF-like domain-containing protein [Lewinellaceae bacterium]|nr:calcium-binding EGF-like domain-containing protein [Saprospiraceae bacterium]MCB9330415.1 calcium-binding EGF-like domain-containing protein [Lewinellaceae bacterium]